MPKRAVWVESFGLMWRACCEEVPLLCESPNGFFQKMMYNSDV